ncbi:hypothetical protein M8J76_017046 [Diaphorina citri]|nr:hypothetical protein M8J76_017046 [Diaphorina citri]KAI5728681.1 hypothetical protein M8J77_019512 [Diaphorina citri]
MLKFSDQMLKFSDQMLKFSDQMLNFSDQMLKFSDQMLKFSDLMGNNISGCAKRSGVLGSVKIIESLPVRSEN